MRRSPPIEPHARLLRRAQQLGFSSAGIVTDPRSGHGQHLTAWLAQGRHGEMGYLERDDAVTRRLDLRETLPGFRSALVVTENYFLEDADGVPDDPAIGVIARYARGRDYHKVLIRKLEELGRGVEKEFGATVRAYVDTGPLLERELGQRAGLGWFGKNTMLIHPERGSYFFVGVLLSDLELEASDPFAGEHCGSCTRCLDACPTGALLGYDDHGAPIMDATRCISYLTIEHRGPIPEELRPLIGNRVFGCDICQEVCPWNQKFATTTAESGYAARGPGERPVGVEKLPGEVAWAGTPGDASTGASGVGKSAHPGTVAPSLAELLDTALDQERWDAFSRGSAIRRSGRAGFARNVCVAIGNWLTGLNEAPEGAVEVLRRALDDGDPLVREHAEWALGRSVPQTGE